MPKLIRHTAVGDAINTAASGVFLTVTVPGCVAAAIFTVALPADAVAPPPVTLPTLLVLEPLVRVLVEEVLVKAVLVDTAPATATAALIDDAALVEV